MTNIKTVVKVLEDIKETLSTCSYSCGSKLTLQLSLTQSSNVAHDHSCNYTAHYTHGNQQAVYSAHN